MKTKKFIISIALAGMFLALAYVMPFLTGQIREIGKMLCPMHIPVLLCGFICGAPYGLIVGAIAPILRSVTLGMPVLFPSAIAMAFELAVYGFTSGFLYNALPNNKKNIYFSLIGSMIIGRVVWGITMFCILGFDFTKFNLANFWAGAIANAVPGIILQFILIPIVVILLEKAKLISNNK